MVGRTCAAGVLAIIAAILFSAARAAPGEILVFAAASTKNAMEEIGRMHRAEGGPPVAFSFASSSDLAKQIENGAPAAIFVSADETWMDYLAERNLIVADSRKDLLGNKLVLIAPKDSTMSLAVEPGMALAEALDGGKLALADPDHVPAGRYAKAALEKLGAWEAVEPSVVRAKDVRAALALVARGEVSAGIVYATDAAASSKVRSVGTFPSETHPRIVYPIAVVAGMDHAEIRGLLEFLTGPRAGEVFARHGFLLEPADAAAD